MIKHCTQCNLEVVVRELTEGILTCPYCDFVLSEAERERSPARMSASTNCSAGAGADALSDSLINSVVPRETAVRRGQETPANEITEHMSRMLDELKWFNEQGITLELKPMPNGWDIKFKV